ncbi:proline-rich transmembrane protein 4 [Nerophis ophidion]|uniref:proline-rich transmembrane protein 4 n=1 Tax=Nerophis ophidion TaxID=159077 RepID=UPI002ADF7B51|nr:proline-rich transmembrane protein 4 [Nerophis ophidion]
MLFPRTLYQLSLFFWWLLSLHVPVLTGEHSQEKPADGTLKWGSVPEENMLPRSSGWGDDQQGVWGDYRPTESSGELTQPIAPSPGRLGLTANESVLDPTKPGGQRSWDQPPDRAVHSGPPSPNGPTEDKSWDQPPDRQVHSGPTEDKSWDQPPDRQAHFSPPLPNDHTEDKSWDQPPDRKVHSGPPSPNGPTEDKSWDQPPDRQVHSGPPSPNGPTEDKSWDQTTDRQAHFGPPSPSGPTEDKSWDQPPDRKVHSGPPSPNGPTEDKSWDQPPDGQVHSGPPSPNGPTEDKSWDQPSDRQVHSGPPSPSGPTEDKSWDQPPDRKVHSGPTEDKSWDQPPDRQAHFSPPLPNDHTEDKSWDQPPDRKVHSGPPSPNGPTEDKSWDQPPDRQVHSGPPSPNGPTEDKSWDQTTDRQAHFGPPSPSGPTEDKSWDQPPDRKVHSGPPSPNGPTEDKSWDQPSDRQVHSGPPSPNGPTEDFTANTRSDKSTGTTRRPTVTTKDGVEDLVPIRGSNVETERDASTDADDDKKVPKANDPLQTEDNSNNTSVKPWGTASPTWTPIYLDGFTPSDSMGPALAHSAGLFVPLYSDWNSALATWGFAWEAHIYGLGSVFTVFGLISVVCLLGLPCRCPSGIPYFTLLHLFLLGFAGIQAFCLIYDAYGHQDYLPPLSSLLLSQLPFPCLTSAFSLAFFILSLRSRKRLSLSLAISPSLSALPKPCLLLSLTLMHFGVSLGCVSLLQLYPSLPAIILLFPLGVFVCLTLFLSCSYVIFYCLIQVDTKHIYRLNDNGECGVSPEMIQPTSCPFAKVDDWGRAAGAGVGAALCLLGCGGLQLYGFLHALGMGGVESCGFRPWPWWGYQVGCRLCEAGVCLGLSLIGTHPLFCHTKSFKNHPRPGSWSRLSGGSPSRGTTLASPGSAHSPVLSLSQDQPENMVVYDVTTRGQSEVLPLTSMVDPPRNGLGCVSKPNQNQAAFPHKQTSPLHKPKNTLEFQLSSQISLGLGADSTGDLQPPSPIDLSRSIDQALFSDSLFTHSIFGLPRHFSSSSSHSLESPKQGTSKQDSDLLESSLYRTSSCGYLVQDKAQPTQPQVLLKSLNIKPPTSQEQFDWKGSVSGSTLGLCSKPKETVKPRSNSWANRGQHMAQNSFPRAIPHLSYHRRYRTLSVASKDSLGCGRLAGTKRLSESKQLEWDMAAQAEFVNVCREIDAFSVCSDTIDL